MINSIFIKNIYDVILYILVCPLLIIKLLSCIIYDFYQLLIINNSNIINSNYNNNIYNNILFMTSLLVILIIIVLLNIHNNNNNNNNMSLENIVEDNINDICSNKSNNSPYNITIKSNSNNNDNNDNNNNDDNISIDSETLTLLEETNIKMKKLALTNKNILIGWYIKINDEPSYCGEIIGLKKRYLRSTLFIIKLDDDTIKEVSLKRIDGDKIKGDVDFTLIEKIN